MLFFGTLSQESGDTGPQIDKTIVFKTHSGRGITRDQIDKMVRFITEKHLIEERSGGLPLRLHDGVLEKDFFQSGWASIIAQKFPESIKKDLEGKILAEKSFKLYKHPSMPMISVDHVWNQSLPELSHAYTDFKRQLTFSPISAEAFDSRVNLYVINQALPATLLKRVLLYQQNIFAAEEPDPSLYHSDLSLLHYRNAEDWFGENFIHLAAQMVFQLSDIAQSQGITVSDREAELDLLFQAQDNFSRAHEAGTKSVDEASFSQHFAYSLRRQGISEKEAVSLWKEVLSYRKWMKNIGNGALVDSLSLNLFNEFANKSCEIRVVDLPIHLQLASDRGHQELAAYLYTVTNNDTFELGADFSNALKSAEEVKKSFPELIQTRLQVGVKRVNLEDLAHDITIKDMLDWQFQKNSWKQLTDKFPELASAQSEHSEDRARAIRELPQKEQGDIDQFSRKQIALSRLGDLDKALENGQYQEEEWQILSNGQIIAGPSKNDHDLYTHLMTTEFNTPFEWHDKNSTAFLSIEINAREEESLLSFKELREYKIIEDFLSHFSKTYYDKVKAEAPDSLKDKEGNLKKASNALKPILASLLGDDATKFAKDKFNAWLSSAKSEILANGELTKVSTSSNETFSPRIDAASQWELEDSTLTVDRGLGHAFLNFDELFLSDEGSYSDVLSSSMGNVYFYNILGFQHSENLKRGFELQETLSQELRKEIFEDQLSHIAEKEAISISYLKSSISS